MIRNILGIRHRAICAANGFCFTNHTCANILGSQKSYRIHEYYLFGRFASTNSVPPQITKILEENQAQVSSEALEKVISTIGPIPDAPLPPAPPVLELHANGEPTLSSLGLDSYWPSGFIQKLLELIHIECDVPWWVSIVAVTAIIRIVLFPVVIKQMRANITMSNDMPAFMVLQTKLTEARAQNDYLAVARYANEMNDYMKSKKISPTKPMLFAGIQGFVLLSFTSALRSMSELPVESFKTGGFLHVLDLTTRDSTFILPITNGLVTFALVKLGIDMPKLMPRNPTLGKVLPYGIAFTVCVVGSTFPSCIGVYWTSTAIIALIQSRFLKQEKIRNYLSIPAAVNNEQAVADIKSARGKKKLGFYASIKQSMENSRIAREVQNRARSDDLAFERAGREAIRKTFKHNPKLSAQNKS